MRAMIREHSVTSHASLRSFCPSYTGLQSLRYTKVETYLVLSEQAVLTNQFLGVLSVYSLSTSVDLP